MDFEAAALELIALGTQARRIATGLGPSKGRLDEARAVLATFPDDEAAISARGAVTHARDDLHGAAYGHLPEVEGRLQQMAATLHET